MDFSDDDLHIVPDPSVATELSQLLQIPDERIYYAADDISFGPLCPLDSLDEFRRLRAIHLTNLIGGFRYKGTEAEYLPQRFEAECDKLLSARFIILWFGAKVQEHLLFSWLLAMFKRLDIETDRLHWVDLPTEPDEEGRYRPTFVATTDAITGTGTYRPLSRAITRSLEAAWQAVTSPKPDALLAFCQAGVSHPAFLRRSLRSFLTRYPSTSNGLSFWDELVLANVRDHGPDAIKLALETARHDVWSNDHIGDWDLVLYRMRRLGNPNLPYPLLILSRDTGADTGERAWLSQAGTSVLAGNANAIELNGIDDWVGGVHLSSKQNRVWCFDGETLVRRS